MASGPVGISTSVFFRDEFGRFAATIEDRVNEGLEDVAKQGARKAGEYAPEIADSFYPVKLGQNEVAWASSHKWAVGLNDGIPAHEIAPGPKGVLASKEREFGPVHHAVRHPGVRGRHFFERSYAYVAPRAMKIIARHVRT